MKLMDVVKELNSNLNDVTHQEKAKKLKKGLLVGGGFAAAIGFIGAFTCFALFAYNAMNFNHSSIFLPFILFLPCGFLASIGSFLFTVGLKIVIVSETSNFVDKTITKYCPHCHDIVNENEQFCSKCGTKLRPSCPKCGSEDNEPGDRYCRKCGSPLR